jgi:hypothetical protein
VLGCVFLWLEISEYGGFGAVKGRVGAVTLPYSSERAYSSEIFGLAGLTLLGPPTLPGPTTLV